MRGLAPRKRFPSIIGLHLFLTASVIVLCVSCHRQDSSEFWAVMRAAPCGFSRQNDHAVATVSHRVCSFSFLGTTSRLLLAI
jgi:hypothetical protein